MIMDNDRDCIIRWHQSDEDAADERTQFSRKLQASLVYIFTMRLASHRFVIFAMVHDNLLCTRKYVMIVIRVKSGMSRRRGSRYRASCHSWSLKCTLHFCMSSGHSIGSGFRLGIKDTAQKPIQVPPSGA